MRNLLNDEFLKASVTTGRFAGYTYMGHQESAFGSDVVGSAFFAEDYSLMSGYRADITYYGYVSCGQIDDAIFEGDMLQVRLGDVWRTIAVARETAAGSGVWYLEMVNSEPQFFQSMRFVRDPDVFTVAPVAVVWQGWNISLYPPPEQPSGNVPYSPWTDFYNSYSLVSQSRTFSIDVPVNFPVDPGDTINPETTPGFEISVFIESRYNGGFSVVYGANSAAYPTQPTWGASKIADPTLTDTQGWWLDMWVFLVALIPAITGVAASAWIASPTSNSWNTPPKWAINPGIDPNTDQWQFRYGSQWTWGSLDFPNLGNSTTSFYALGFKFRYRLQ